MSDASQSPGASGSSSDGGASSGQGESREVLTSQRFETTHVLFVDPEAAYLKLVELAFKRRGHKVSAVHSPAQAIEILEREPVDVLVCELHFPDGGGYGLLEHIRAKTQLRRLPAIVLTKDRKARSKVRALEIGADDVLHKPCLLEELFVRVESMIRKRREIFMAAHDVRGDLAGKLRSLPVQDLFPLLQQGRKTGLLRLGDSGQELARVWWRTGEVIAAEFGPLKGEEAIYALFPLRSGNFEFHAGQAYLGANNVGTNVTGLLLEGLRRLDETVTFQLIGGRPQAGPRGAHIEWFSGEFEVETRGTGTMIVPRKPHDSGAVAALIQAFERLPADAPTSAALHFADLREIKELFGVSTNGATYSASVVLACDLEEGVRLLSMLFGAFHPGELRRGLRSGVELFPTAKVALDDRHVLKLLVAPVNETNVLVRSVPAADAFFVAPPSGRWIAPEQRDGFKGLLRHARPQVCLPVGDGTVVEGLSAVLREAGVNARVSPVVERLPSERKLLVQALQGMLKDLAGASEPAAAPSPEARP
ncbi:MAG: response regulator [Planctomycetes bacterium]|nr:response regulator [Planctomycetota bacterium]